MAQQKNRDDRVSRVSELEESVKLPSLKNTREKKSEK